jgi:hypothetical protein
MTDNFNDMTDRDKWKHLRAVLEDELSYWLDRRERIDHHHLEWNVANAKIDGLREALGKNPKPEPEEVPMCAIGSDELKGDLGDTIKCPHCGEEHEVKYGDRVLKDGKREPSKLLAFYSCGEKSYLAGINGERICRGRG